VATPLDWVVDVMVTDPIGGPPTGSLWLGRPEVRWFDARDIVLVPFVIAWTSTLAIALSAARLDILPVKILGTLGLGFGIYSFSVRFFVRRWRLSGTSYKLTAELMACAQGSGGSVSRRLDATPSVQVDRVGADRFNLHFGTPTLSYRMFVGTDIPYYSGRDRGAITFAWVSVVALEPLIEHLRSSGVHVRGRGF